MKTPKELKSNVTQRLRCCWGENAAIFFITVGGISVIALSWAAAADLLGTEKTAVFSDGTFLAVTAMAFLLLWGISRPFSYGVKWYRLRQIRGDSVHARSIFICYGSLRRMGQIFRLSAALFVRRLYFAAPITGMIAAGFLLENKIVSAGEGIAYSAAAVMIFLLSGAAAVAVWLINCKYAPVPYLFVLEPDRSPKELIEKSKKISEGKTSYILESMLSAANCFLPCLLVFPTVLIVPYMCMLYTAAINEIIENGEEKEDSLGGEENLRIRPNN